MLQKLKTQTQAYWQDEFAVSIRDLEFVYSLLIETGLPLDTTQIAQAIVEQRLDEELNQVRMNLKRGRAFQPQGTFHVGEGLVFPALDCAYGVVVNERLGYNPEYGSFRVIEVQFDGENKTREFAATLSSPHKLNVGDSIDDILASLSNIPAAEIVSIYGPMIERKLENSLVHAENMDFTRFGSQWYLKGLLADVHIGYRNIIEAVIDVTGRPLAPRELLKQIELPAEVRPEAQLFSLNYWLQQDERFDDVGTDMQVMWYLRRLEPTETQFPPRRLVATTETYDRALLTEDLLRMERELDDEMSLLDLSGVEATDVPAVSLVLTYPHRRVGTIPLNKRIRQLFPKGSYQHTRITLVDGQTGSPMPAWVMHQHKYISGLEEWFKKNSILVGGYITLEKTDEPLKVIINYIPKRERREWIRVVRSDGERLRFEMKKQACRCEYDELMVLGEDKAQEVDALWVKAETELTPIIEVLHQVFPELAKLNPQGTVHAKTIYLAANLLRRCPPGPVFAALVGDASFVPVGDGYWVYNE